MSLSSFFSSLVGVVHADAPEEKTEVVPHVEQQKDEGEEEPSAEDSAVEEQDSTAAVVEEEEEEEPEDVCAHSSCTKLTRRLLQRVSFFRSSLKSATSVRTRANAKQRQRILCIAKKRYMQVRDSKERTVLRNCKCLVQCFRTRC